MDFIDQLKKKRNSMKVLIVGSGGVGKTSLLKVLKTGDLIPELEETYQRTLFMEIETIKLGKENYEFDVVFMDLAGQTDLPMHALVDFERLSMGGVDLIILVFANNNLQSLIHLQSWYGLLYGYYTDKKVNIPPIILVQNKCDLPRDYDQSLVSSMIEVVDQIKEHFEISLVNGQGLTELMDRLNTMDTITGE